MVVADPLLSHGRQILIREDWLAQVRSVEVD